MSSEMRIYVADLAAYNSGYLVGSWIDLPCDDIHAEVQKVLDQGTSIRVFENIYDGFPSEEWSIHDFEAPFKIEEYDDLDSINKLAEEFEKMNEQDIKKVSYLMDYQGETMQTALEKYEDVSIYEDMSYTELASELVDEGYFGDIPDGTLCQYIDYASIGRDLKLDYSQINGDLFYSQY